MLGLEACIITPGFCPAFSAHTFVIYFTVSYKDSIWFFFFSYIIYCVCAHTLVSDTCACLSVPQHSHGDQTTTGRTLSLPRGSRELNSGHQVGAGASLPAEPVPQPRDSVYTALSSYTPLPESPRSKGPLLSPQTTHTDPDLPPVPAKPTLARLPLHGCRLPLHCHCTHTLSPLQREDH